MSFYTLLSLFVILLPVIFILYFIFKLVLPLLIAPDIRLLIKKRQLARDEHLESLDEGGIEEPHPYRNLTDDEKYFLRDQYKNAQVVFDNWWWLLPLFCGLDVLILIFYSKVIVRFNFDVIGFLFFFFTLQAALIGWSLSHFTYYLDLIAPVFKMQGQVVKEVRRAKPGDYYFLTIRSKTFSEKQFFGLGGFFKTINDGDEIAVEYSPRTKHVWKMSKTEDLK